MRTTIASALGPESPVIQSDSPARYNFFMVPTPFFQTESVSSEHHCLIGDAEIVDRRSGVSQAVIPASTCLGARELLVPLPSDGTMDADPEIVIIERNDERTPTPVSGQLAVNIDGCTTIGGKRVAWPRDTTIDEVGTVELRNGPAYVNGSEVVVDALPPSERYPSSSRCPGRETWVVPGDG